MPAQREQLKQLRASIDPNKVLEWEEGEDFCDWFGIDCDGQDLVSVM